MAIQVTGVHFSYQPAQPQLLNIPNLVIAPNERVFLKGPSGSGKTTLLSLISGVLAPTAGTIAILGQDLGKMTPAAKDRMRADHIGFIFQMFNLIPYLSLEDNILLPLRFSAQRKAKITVRNITPADEARRLVQGLGLSTDSTFLRKRPSEISVGQQQRIAAARAFIGNPEIIIADEPTSALDRDSQDQFLQVLFSEAEHSATSLVFVSHDDRLAAHFSRTLSVMDFAGTKA